MRLICLVIFSVNISYAQELVRENIGSSGASAIVNKIHIKQSIGQQSALNGTVSNNDITLRQGFQQPIFRIEKNSLTDISVLDLVIFPNPFRYDISVRFNQEPTERINILIFDTKGRLIKKLDFDPLIEIIIPCKELATGSYLLNIKTSKKQYSANIIKQ
jgi:hypothetical protein|tara:strand:+ start:172 stop:651 length:480 start_codon:yes stop_codon:yes gene_type:complete